MKTVNKNQAIKLTKVSYYLEKHKISLDEIMLGVQGITLMTIKERLKKKMR